MGRQWLHANAPWRWLKKGQATGKIVREIMVAAKMGGPDPEGNARLFAAVEKARKESVSRDVIERAIRKGAGVGDEKLVMEHVVFEGYAPHKVPVIIEVLYGQREPHRAGNPRAVQEGPARQRRQQQVSFRSRRPRRGASSRRRRGHRGRGH